MLAVTVASASACSNDALRSELRSGQLPDCRAYELVTPAYKEGAFFSSVFALSGNGAHLIGSSFGVLPGTEEDGLGQGTALLGAVYELSRGASGWTAAALDPPGSLFHSNGLFDASADFSKTLWELGRHRASPLGTPEEEAPCPPREGEEEAQPEAVTDFYIQYPRGTFTRVGPVTPEPCTPNATRYTYLGGSADLSRVLFTAAAGFHWPFDETEGGASPLYEYVGLAHTAAEEAKREPLLVGVEGGAGSRELVSKCGTLLGSGLGNSMYNAISSSGARVFFTALACGEHSQTPVNELLAREELPAEEGELPARAARTVAISEPLAGNCNACVTGGELRNAHFEGASIDGSKAFFTTEQELLAGAAGENLYEYDFDAPAGEKVSRISVALSSEAQVQGVARISEDGSHVYFVAKGVLAGENTEGGKPVLGEDNLYVYGEGHTSFIGTLSPNDEEADWTHADDRQVKASADGRLLEFTSQNDLTHEGVAPGRKQVFRYDAETGVLVRASIGQDGYDNNNRTPAQNAEIAARPFGSDPYTSNDSPTQAEGVLAPEDGAVFFTSADPLTPQALADQVDVLLQPAPNVYEYRNGHVYLISDGHDASTVDSHPGVLLLGSDASGENVFFTTSDSLVGQDTDTQQDIYDVRAEGGFPAPAGAPSCAGEGCRGGLGATPSLLTAGSAAQPAEASAPPAVATAKPKAKIKKKAKAKQRRGKARKATRRDRTRARTKRR
jgi:hypothetical protein